jgi:hypothetical protein
VALPVKLVFLMADAAVFVRGDFYVRPQGGAFQEFELSQLNDFNRADLYDLIPLVKRIANLSYPVVLLLFLAGYMVGVLSCTLVGLFMNLFVKAPVQFEEIFKLAAYGRTAPVILRAFFGLIPGMSLGFWPFYILFAVYMLFALRAVKAQ